MTSRERAERVRETFRMTGHAELLVDQIQAAIDAAVAEKDEELRMERLRTQGHITDKHRILREYDDRVRELSKKVETAVAEEREACAKVAEEYVEKWSIKGAGTWVVDNIRARGSR